jgi:hypothetical protein
MTGPNYIWVVEVSFFFKFIQDLGLKSKDSNAFKPNLN